MTAYLLSNKHKPVLYFEFVFPILHYEETEMGDKNNVGNLNNNNIQEKEEDEKIVVE